MDSSPTTPIDTIHARSVLTDLKIRFLRYQISSIWAMFFTAVILYSCATTKYSYEYAQPRTIHLTRNNLVLISQLPGKSTQMYLERVEQLFTKRDIPVAYEVSDEWDLSVAGVEFPIDPSDFKILNDLAYTHVLQFQNIYTRTSPILSYFTPLETSLESIPEAYKPTFENPGNQARLLIRLISLEYPYDEYSLSVSTNIGSTAFVHDDDGETHVNLSDQEMAKYKALSNGVKRLLKDCFVE